ncbi:MAG: phosphate ABC transporter permease subunit PstC [Nitrososphaera sp.]|nr:phosphate ABC transporter permease subunit PstC [Nitrososphaera sp.]
MELNTVSGKEEHRDFISRFMLRKKLRQDKIFRWILFLVAGYTIFIIGMLFYTLAEGSTEVFELMGLEFIYGTDWNAVPGRESFGALPYVIGTLLSAAIAMTIAVPISLMIAIFVSEIATFKIGSALGFIVEVLAAVPSVIYGFWALFVFRLWFRDNIEFPLFQTFGDSISIFARTPFGLDILTAGTVLAIMIIPIISAVCRDVIRTVPNSQREAAYSLGTTRWEMIKTAILPYSKSGLLGASILGLGRGIGETILVTMIIGNAQGINAIPDSPFSPSQTIPSAMANQFGESSGVQLSALIGLALILFVVALGVNVLAHFMVSRMVKTVDAR